MPILAAAHSLFAVAALVVIVAASVVMFVWNVRRSTTDRPRLELLQWARSRRMDLRDDPGQSAVPPILTQLLPGIRWDRLLCHEDDDGGGARAFARGLSPHGTHHLLILRTPDAAADWPPTALRPTHGSHAFVDRLTDLRPYPTLPGTERFTTLGTTLHAARLLADSHVRGLLPPDLALALHGRWLLLDFSHRPFDPLEFSRLLPLADQLLANLPQPA